MDGVNRVGRPAQAAGRALRIAQRVLIGVLGVAVLVVVGLTLRLVTAGLGSWDRRTLLAVVRWRGRTAIDAAHIASLLGRSWVLVIVAVAAGGLARRGGRGAVPVWAALMAIAAQNIIKVIVRRPRPPIRHLEHVTSWSFPSGHATESTAVLTGVLIACWPLLRTRPARAAAVVTAAAAEFTIAGSRLVLGVHYPTDVGAGIVLGAIAAALAAVNPGLVSSLRVSWRSQRSSADS